MLASVCFIKSYFKKNKSYIKQFHSNLEEQINVKCMKNIYVYKENFQEPFLVTSLIKKKHGFFLLYPLQTKEIQAL